MLNVEIVCAQPLQYMDLKESTPINTSGYPWYTHKRSCNGKSHL